MESPFGTILPGPDADTGGEPPESEPGHQDAGDITADSPEEGHLDAGEPAEGGQGAGQGLILGKYRDHKALERAHQALEAKLGTQAAQAQALREELAGAQVLLQLAQGQQAAGAQAQLPAAGYPGQAGVVPTTPQEQVMLTELEEIAPGISGKLQGMVGAMVRRGLQEGLGQVAGQLAGAVQQETQASRAMGQALQLHRSMRDQRAALAQGGFEDVPEIAPEMDAVCKALPKLLFLPEGQLYAYALAKLLRGAPGEAAPDSEAARQAAGMPRGTGRRMPGSKRKEDLFGHGQEGSAFGTIFNE